MGRNGIIPCYVHKKFDLEQESTHRTKEKIRNVFSKVMDSFFYKTIVILISVVFVGFGVYGWIEIQQIFYPFLLMPSDSYLREWISNHKENYPDDGWEAEVYSGPLHYSDLENIDKLGKILVIDNIFYTPIQLLV